MPRAPRRQTGDAPFVPANSYAWTHGVIDLPNRNEHRIRFYEDNRYQILDPYTVLPNDPWYVRIRHNVKPIPAEWTRMLFTPYRPFMVGTWVPGKLVAPNTVEFERKRIWWDGKKYPDVRNAAEPGEWREAVSWCFPAFPILPYTASSDRWWKSPVFSTALKIGRSPLLFGLRSVGRRVSRIVDGDARDSMASDDARYCLCLQSLESTIGFNELLHQSLAALQQRVNGMPVSEGCEFR